LWKSCSTVLRESGQKVLGKTTGKLPPPDKETWWWNEEVKKAVKRKKDAKKKWDLTGNQEDIDEYQKVNNESKQAVAVAKAKSLNVLYEELDTPEGE